MEDTLLPALHGPALDAQRCWLPYTQHFIYGHGAPFDRVRGCLSRMLPLWGTGWRSLAVCCHPNGLTGSGVWGAEGRLLSSHWGANTMGVSSVRPSLLTGSGCLRICG